MTLYSHTNFWFFHHLVLITQYPLTTVKESICKFMAIKEPQWIAEISLNRSLWFEICRINMYLIRFLANFKVFWGFLWILRDFVDLPEFCGSKTMQNIPVRGWTKAFRELTGTHRVTIVNNEHNNISPHWWYHLFVLFCFVFFAFVCSFFWPGLGIKARC